MVLTLYKTTDDPNTIGKSKTALGNFTLTNIGADGHDVDKINPVIRLSDSNSSNWINQCNYAFIDTFTRYYFVKTRITDFGEVELTMHVDVLESFKASIKGCEAKLDRYTNGDQYIYDPTRKVSVKSEYHDYFCNNGGIVFSLPTSSGVGSEPGYYLITSGNGNVAFINA